MGEDRKEKKNRHKSSRSDRSDKHKSTRSNRSNRPNLKKLRNGDNYRALMDKLDKINTKYFPKGFSTRVLSKEPYIVKIRRFLNTEEIDSLLALAEGKFERSTIVVSDEMIESNSRTSETAFITDNGHYDTYDKPIERVLEKVSYLAGCKRNQIEAIMVVKYTEGKEYDEHWDFFEPGHTDTMGDEGNRVSTFFCYLTSLDKGEGGETEFPRIGIKARPSKGTAIFWWNMKPSGKLIRDTLHQGNPVLGKTVKYGCNIWVRKRGW